MTRAADCQNVGNPKGDTAIVLPLRRRLWASPVIGILLVLIAVIAAFAAVAPGRFATYTNAYNVLADVSVLLVVAMPTTLILISGHLDLSIGSVIAFSQVIAVKTMIALGGDGWATILTGLAGSILAAVIWGTAQGWLIAKAGIPAFIVTLAGFGAALGAAYLLTGGQDIARVPPTLVYRVGVGSVLGLPVITLVAMVVVALTTWTLRQTRFGRYAHAIGSDAMASERAGINVASHTIKVFTVAGTCYGIAAFLDVARFSTTTVGGHNEDALNAIAAVSLGGTSLFGGAGGALGSVVGVFIPAVLQNGLVIMSVQPYWQLIAVAAALVIAVHTDQRRRRIHRR